MSKKIEQQKCIANAIKVENELKVPFKIAAFYAKTMKKCEASFPRKERDDKG